MTIAQILGVKQFPYQEIDERGNEVYYEDHDGFWIKSVYDDSGNRIYYEDSYGHWIKYEYDDFGNYIYSEDSEENIWRKES
jgi:YD repeat-containing protein